MERTKIKAVDMVRQIRDRQYEETRNMNTNEKKSYYRQRTQTLMSRLHGAIEKWRKKMIAA